MECQVPILKAPGTPKGSGQLCWCGQEVFLGEATLEPGPERAGAFGQADGREAV